ncbi:DUF6365 family protein [Streptomyces hiroshimensis]|uniref:Glycosyltransferase n=1 Tax=Streptomyces hiroshimensis TaxID=66424 RepID=A0ABQ2YT94_9ACTN|nr:DUF6365 family protein [Streptomyces hiroshimensis]GGX91786.1 hypothetical protein GCM10010324_41830 [Streptomyces hiroshimensis]
MRVLFMSPLAKSLHETTIGLDLADQLKGAGVVAHFVIDADNEDQLKTAGYPYTVITPAMGGRVREEVGRVVGEFRPDAIVLSDYLAHWLTHLVSYETDPWYVQDFGVPVIPLDLHDLTNTTRELEVLGKTVVADGNLLDMPVHLHPVPMGRPEARAGGLGLPYRANSGIEPLTDAARAEVRRLLGLGGAERLLMFPTLPWQEIMQTRAGPRTRELAVRVPQLIGHYLRQLPDDTHFVVAGPYLDGLGLPPERVHVESSYTAQRYHALLGASDAVMSAFMLSYALERAVLADVPGMFTLNSHAMGEAAGAGGRRAGAPDGLSPAVRGWLADFPGAVPSFHMWPLSWNKVVGPLLVDNPFADTTVRTELFDEQGVVEALTGILYDPLVRGRLAEARAAYRDGIDRLPATAEVFATAAQRVGLSL